MRQLFILTSIVPLTRSSRALNIHFVAWRSGEEDAPSRLYSAFRKNKKGVAYHLLIIIILYICRNNTTTKHSINPKT